MPPQPPPSPRLNGAGRGNLFIEDDPDISTPLEPTDSAGRPSRPARRGRGLVVAVDAPTPLAGTESGIDAVRFTRSPTGVSGLRYTARRNALRADANAQRLLARMAARPYGALLALIAVAALLLATSWLGLSLRDAAGARDHAQARQRAVTVALGQARGDIRTLTAQRDRTAGAVRAARHQQVSSAAAAARWRTRARTARHQLSRARRHQRR